MASHTKPIVFMKWFAGALIVLLIAVVLDLGLLAYSMYALLAVLIVSRYLARTWAENVVAVRECNKLTAGVGETVAVVVTVENRGPLPVTWVFLEDLLPRHALIFKPPHLGVTGNRVQLTRLKKGGRSTIYYQLACNRRGYFQLGPLVLETGDLFGLHRRYRVLTEPHFLLVYPEVIPLEGFELASRRPIGEVRMSHRLFEDPTRIAGVRAYQAGDPLNRVHWRATARTGELHSKVYEPSTVAGATIVLDFHRDSYDSKHEPYRSELAITAAASMANAVYQLGQQVGLATNARDAADRIRQEGWDYDLRTRDAARQAAGMLAESDRLTPVVVPTQRGPEQFMRILETLARLELTDGLTLAQLLGETANRMPRDATVIVLLSRVSDQSAIALGNLRRRGFAVTAFVSIYDEYEYAAAAGKLMAEGVEARQLVDREAIATMCRRYVLR